MDLALFPTQAPVPFQLSAYPEPVRPDHLFCNKWFATRPGTAGPAQINRNDCRMALSNLPVNADPIQYRQLRKSLADPKGLLVEETHGTCQLRFHASGKWAEENDFAVELSPNVIRDMFGRLIEKCVSNLVGGFMTKSIGNSIDWLLREDTEFPGDPGKGGDVGGLHIPQSATFFTAMIWNTHTGSVGQFEPGANHELAGEILGSSLTFAASDLKKKDPDSGFADELQDRADFISFICAIHQARLEQPYMNWWGDRRRRRIGGETAAVGDGSLALVNATGLQVENTTSLEPGRFGEGNCIANAGGPSARCSSSRRMERRKQRPVYDLQASPQS